MSAQELASPASPASSEVNIVIDEDVDVEEEEEDDRRKEDVVAISPVSDAGSSRSGGRADFPRQNGEAREEQGDLILPSSLAARLKLLPETS